MALIQDLISSTKYNIKCPYAMEPIGICIHNTANKASARNEISYMKNNDYEVSYHIAVDDIEAIQAIPFNRNAWAAGDGNGEGNRKYIHLEICYSTLGEDKFAKAEQRTAMEVASLLKHYGWSISNVKKHQDFSGKICPHLTLQLGWQRFLNMIQAELDKLNNVQEPSNELYRVRLTWDNAASQKGAYSVLENAKSSCPVGYSVFNSKGVSVYKNEGEKPVAPPPPPSKPKVDVFYKFDNLPWVKNLQDDAGIRGVNARNLYVYPSIGEVLFRVSRVNGDYYSWVQNYKTSTGNYDYAGNGVPIDRIQMKLKNLNGYSIRYRVRLTDGTLLPWVMNDSDYAGIRGRAISNIEVEII